MRRKALPPSHLYALLSAEFLKLRAGGCEECRMPLPTLRQRRHDGMPNWRIGTLSHCCVACENLIARVVVRVSTKYDLTEHIEAAQAVETRLERR